jgi:hypothetical protein
MVEMEFLNAVQEETEDEGNNLASVGELLSLILDGKARQPSCVSPVQA